MPSSPIIYSTASGKVLRLAFKFHESKVATKSAIDERIWVGLVRVAEELGLDHLVPPGGQSSASAALRPLGAPIAVDQTLFFRTSFGECDVPSWRDQGWEKPAMTGERPILN
jgi:hypothetical protein